ncbi:FMN-binding protein [bacterium D16-51]|nr:FMN-binding protein [bacterium D16-59]RKI62855.1 FMN-binding protein [bacterium D16-51]
MKRVRLLLMLFAAVVLAFMPGCSSSHSMKDGYYTAEMSDYSHGWKEYLRIQVKRGKIVSAEFNAKNKSGFIKAWDNTYMKNMMSGQGTYPNKYTREYVQQIIEGQGEKPIDAVSGASHSGGNFVKLSEAAIERAVEGNAETIIVEAEEE